jgi:hypothetical protein
MFYNIFKSGHFKASAGSLWSLKRKHINRILTINDKLLGLSWNAIAETKEIKFPA